MKLNERQKQILSEKLLDFANLIGAATIIGQIFSKDTRWDYVVTGFFTVLVLYTYSIYLGRE